MRATNEKKKKKGKRQLGRRGVKLFEPVRMCNLSRVGPDMQNPKLMPMEFLCNQKGS